jgi:hypothetical protein
MRPNPTAPRSAVHDPAWLNDRPLRALNAATDETFLTEDGHGLPPLARAHQAAGSLHDSSPFYIAASADGALHDALRKDWRLPFNLSNNGADIFKRIIALVHAVACCLCELNRYATRCL